MQKQLSGLIERLEAFEQRVGVELRGLYASRNEAGDIHINGELHSTLNPELDINIQVVATLYDSGGYVLYTESYPFIRETFFGFEAFSIWIPKFCMPDDNKVSKIRVYPKKAGY